MIVEFKNGLLGEDAPTQFVATTHAEGIQLVLTEKIPRGRVWSPHELAIVRSLNASREERRALVEAKLLLDCHVKDAKL